MTVATVTAPNGRRVITEVDADFQSVYKWCSEHYKFVEHRMYRDSLSAEERLRWLEAAVRK